MKESNEELFKRLIADNKLGIKDEKEFEIVARNYTAIRSDELRINPIKGNFDYQHLKNIHKYIFQDVFHWAGKDRMEVGLSGFISKGDSLFCSAEYIHGEAKKIFDNLAKNNYLKNSKDLNHFAKDLANFTSDLNALHPFREGNGRTQRIFLNELAKNAGYKLDLNLISKEKMIEASIEAMKCRNGKLEAVIKSNLKNFRQNLDLEQNKGISL
ncbi:cell filamentation protein Fic [Campylobacter jejuni]|nr:cell filamentation protein Fic [Campylobacter jejuni]EAL9374702.1 cell filamentation protein Fic [Campylobacter jejuni]EAL9420514.1 cell filamentation protein Fic [Campylobacter jejuni]EDP0187164.1 cell filamentation protein Fic [Campylobacter jejuni]EDP5366914.1 cell filamentation protein Fic [Campylobacter jejuni]